MKKLHIFEEKLIMKKILFIIGITMLFSCTKNDLVKNYGGKETINLKENEKLLNVTWKEDNMWILTEDTIKDLKYFREISSYGIMEGEITIK